MAVESYIQMNEDGEGKQIRTRVVDINGESVHLNSTFLVDGEGNILNPVEASTTPKIYNVLIPEADHEYPQALSTGTKKLQIATRDRSAFRLAWETGKVGAPTNPYETIAAGEVYFEDNLNLTGVTVYLACPVGSKVIEISECT